MSVWMAGVATGLAVLVLWPVPTHRPVVRRGPRRAARDRSDVRRHRLVLTALAAAGGLTLLPAPTSLPAAGILGAVVWTTIGRSEPLAVRRARDQAVRELPDVVQLLGMALQGGASLSAAVRQVHAARPGEATALLVAAERRLELGVDWSEAWPVDDPGFARLARSLARSSRSGAPVAAAVSQLGGELAAQRRAAAADRARTVGVRAAVPLGLCLLPAFLLVGIVPVVVASMTALPW